MDDGVRELLQVYGSVAYASGSHGVPEREAARRALQAMIHRAREIEQAKVLLAQMDGKGWWRLPLERDERPL